MTKRIRIGHMGTKHDHSIGKLRCVRKFPEIFEIVGIGDDDPAQRDRLRHEFPYSEYPIMTTEALLEANCDCMLVEGFEYDLPHDARRCVERGIAVHIDKPAGRDLEAFADTLRIAREKQLPVQMGYMYRYNPAVRKCLELVDAGKLGQICSVTAIMNTGHPSEKQQWLQRFDGGIMFFLGCHMVDLVFRLQGMPQRVTPFLCRDAVLGSDSVIQSTAVLEYANGISLVQANACEINGYGRRQLVVCGTKGTFEIRPLEREAVVWYTDAEAAEPFEDRHQEFRFDAIPDSCRYDEMMLDFVAMVRGEQKNPYSYDYELQLQALILACCGYPIDPTKQNLTTLQSLSMR